ncbi:MAG: adenosylcobinamide-phosphate synthase CbiB [Lachnospiraceae bacterium]|nr:adenosylcobinamide-phosphate synthase CbiB [Lachnospiraceae bacterium]
MIYHMIALSIGYLADLVIGDPHGMPHPIRLIGRLIGALERLLHKSCDPKKELLAGSILWILITVMTVIITGVIFASAYICDIRLGVAVEAILTFTILAAGSLCRETMKVHDALPDLADARKALSMIVGRDTNVLDEAGIIRAAVETVAENTSDGVLAPLLYTAIGGPVLGMLYKAVNTMDSMLGYHNERYEYFGRCAARADDVFNFIPARLSALFMIASAWVLRIFTKEYDAACAYRIWRRDRMKHKSPNSAQTESVCAGALAVRLGGNATYGGIPVKKPTIGDPVKEIERSDICRAIRLMFATEGIFVLLILAAFAALTWCNS